MTDTQLIQLYREFRELTCKYLETFATGYKEQWQVVNQRIAKEEMARKKEQQEKIKKQQQNLF